MGVRGIRGAITIVEDSSEEILSSTKELMEEVLIHNPVQPDEVAAIFITVTNDIKADFPAKAVRSIPGWDMVPLMCSNEIPVPGSLPKCIRIMMMVNTDLSQKEVKHVFLRDAVKLRPDLVQGRELTSK